MGYISSGSFDLDDNNFQSEVSITANGYDSLILKKQYDNVVNKYEQLGINIQYVLLQTIKSNNLDITSVDFRLKTFSSFWKKCIKKRYSNPLSEIVDVCGIRIVCDYNSDLKAVVDIIQNEFNVIEVVDRSNEVFGYNSTHFIVNLKEEWLQVPLFRGLNNLNAEIQVRTVLMHAWSKISRKYFYNNEKNLPSSITKKLKQVSRKIIEIDNQLENIKADILKLPKSKFKEKLIYKQIEIRG